MRGDLHPLPRSQQIQATRHNRMLNVIHPLHLFGARVTNSDVVVELGLQRKVDVLVDGGADHSSAVLAIIACQIASASGKTQAARRFADDHAGLLQYPKLPDHCPTAAAGPSKVPCRPATAPGKAASPTVRSEERRVGKECRSR